MEKFNDLADLELKNKLAFFEEELEDIENEKSFIFKQSGMHVSSSKVVAQMAEFDAEAAVLKERIAECKAEIKRRGI